MNKQKKQHSGISNITQDLKESGLWFSALIVIILAAITICLDIYFWDKDSLKELALEGNSIVIDLIIVVVLIGYFEFKQNKKHEIVNLTRELFLLRRSKSENDILKKADVLKYAKDKKIKFYSLKHFNFEGIILPDIDFSKANLRFSKFKKAIIPLCDFSKANLMDVDFRESILIQANFTDATLYEADFSGADLTRVNFMNADLSYANFIGVKNLTKEQLLSGRNWEKSFRDQALALGKTPPDPSKLSVGHQFRKLYREGGNPMYPYSFGKQFNSDGTQETIITKNEDED